MQPELCSAFYLFLNSSFQTGTHAMDQDDPCILYTIDAQSSPLPERLSLQVEEQQLALFLPLTADSFFSTNRMARILGGEI
jgi:hypothetical protein